jgi:hypothetical protein
MIIFRPPFEKRKGWASLQMIPQLSKRHLTIIGVIVGAAVAVLVFFVLQPAFRAKKTLRLLAAVEVGHTTVEEFKKMASAHGVSVRTVSDTFDVSQRNSVLEHLHLAPPTIIGMNVRTSNGVVDLVEVWAWIGKYSEFAKIYIDEFDTHQTGCGDVLTCVKPTSSTNTTTVFFAPATPEKERARLLSLNTWCLSKIGGCKSSREFFPVAWQN